MAVLLNQSINQSNHQRALHARLQSYGSLTLETIALRKRTIKTHTTINKQFMVDFNIPPKAERDLSIPIMMLEQHFTVNTPGADHIKYDRDSLQNTIDDISSETITCYTDGSRTALAAGLAKSSPLTTKTLP